MNAFADDKLNINQTGNLRFHKAENIVLKGEKAGKELHLLIFYFSHMVFNRLFPQEHQRPSLSDKNVNPLLHKYSV